MLLSARRPTEASRAQSTRRHAGTDDARALPIVPERHRESSTTAAGPPMTLRNGTGAPPAEPSEINIGRARYRLLGEPYKAPRVKFGQMLKDEIRGDVEVIGFTDARIRWPIGKYGRTKSLAVVGDLLAAIRHESAMAI